MKSTKLEGSMRIEIEEGDACKVCSKVNPPTCPLIIMAHKIEMTVAVSSCGYLHSPQAPNKRSNQFIVNTGAVVIEIDGKKFKIHGSNISRESVLKLAGKPDDYEVWLLREMRHEIPDSDTLVTDTIEIQEGYRFRTSPVADGVSI